MKKDQKFYINLNKHHDYGYIPDKKDWLEDSETTYKEFAGEYTEQEIKELDERFLAFKELVSVTGVTGISDAGQSNTKILMTKEEYKKEFKIVKVTYGGGNIEYVLKGPRMSPLTYQTVEEAKSMRDKKFEGQYLKEVVMEEVIE